MFQTRYLFALLVFGLVNIASSYRCTGLHVVANITDTISNSQILSYAVDLRTSSSRLGYTSVDVSPSEITAKEGFTAEGLLFHSEVQDRSFPFTCTKPDTVTDDGPTQAPICKHTFVDAWGFVKFDVYGLKSKTSRVPTSVLLLTDVIFVNGVIQRIDMVPFSSANTCGDVVTNNLTVKNVQYTTTFCCNRWDPEPAEEDLKSPPCSEFTSKIAILNGAPTPVSTLDAILKPSRIDIQTQVVNFTSTVDDVLKYKLSKNFGTNGCEGSTTNTASKCNVFILNKNATFTLGVDVVNPGNTLKWHAKAGGFVVRKGGIVLKPDGKAFTRDSACVNYELDHIDIKSNAERNVTSKTSLCCTKW